MKNTLIILFLFGIIISNAQRIDTDIKIYVKYRVKKNGKRIDVNNLFIFNHDLICDNVEYSRYIDKESGLVGIRNRQGKIIISPKYNGLSEVKNGIIVALKNSVNTSKVHTKDDDKKLDCRHYIWKEGQISLINIKDQILIEDFDYNRFLNLSSLQKSKTPTNNSTRTNFKTLSGQYYSFIDNKEELKAKLSLVLSKTIDKTVLLNLVDDTISYRGKKRSWSSQNKNTFVNKYFNLIKEKLLSLKGLDLDDKIYVNTHVPNMIWKASPKNNSNPCEKNDVTKQPTLRIVLTNKVNGRNQRDSFDFLRTNEGYKLIRIEFAKKEFK